MHEYLYHVIYKTTNLVNNKIYVGLHSTDKIEDGYIGTGWQLKKAIRKYGRDKFKREILYVFRDRDEARKMEAKIVNEEFIARPDTYNLLLGGISIDQDGERNPMYGKVAHNSKMVCAIHKTGTIIIANSLESCGNLINMARQNVRKLMQSGKQGKMGWTVRQISEDEIPLMI